LSTTVTAEISQMRESLEVERLGNAGAASLARYLTQELVFSAKVSAARSSCVVVETQSGSLAELLSALEEWGQRHVISSLCVRLNGRSYTQESPKPANILHPATT
jgi:hypothetical protein